MRVWLAAGVIVLAIGAPQAQTPPRDQARLTSIGTATVAGAVVIDDETRGPLRRATLTLQRVNSEDLRTTTSDDQGHFVFDALPAGSFRLTASKGGYLALNYGAPKPGGMPGRVITLAEGQQFSLGAIALMRGAVIAGRLLDRNSHPVGDTEVTASRFVIINGERQLRTEESPRTTMTNGHGEYRIYGLIPGEYVLSARPGFASPQAETTNAEMVWAQRRTGQAPPPGRSFTYAPTLFPGSVDPSGGVPIVLARGEEKLGVDFSLQYVPVARVTGIVTGPDGQPAAGVIVRNIPKRQILLELLGSTRTGPDGRFTLNNLMPSEYSLVARGAGAMPGPLSLWGKVDLTVFGEDVTDRTIQLQPGFIVGGTIVGAARPGVPLPNLARIRVTLTTPDGGFGLTTPGSVAVTADGAFTFPGVMPGTYRLSIPVPAATGAGASPWSVRSAMLGDRDIADASFEVVNENLSNIVVTLTDSQAQIAGHLADAAGQPAAELYVLVFTTDKASWLSGSRRIRSARALENGAYVIDALPAGSYYLCALTELDLMLINEPSYLEQLVPSAMKLTLAEGEKKKQDLQVVR
jgi:hypothetical protein